MLRIKHQAVSLLILLVTLSLSDVISFRHYPRLSAKPYPFSSSTDDALAATAWLQLSREARDQAWLYEQTLSTHHLLDSMVVHRTFDGEAHSVCDSLLFSSLRYIALLKLGWQEKAAVAWVGIEKAYIKQRWTRHPRCSQAITSRDMIVGLLSALRENPPHHKEHVANILRIIEESDGAIDFGPFYVSLMSPILGELIKNMSLQRNWPFRKLPHEVRLSFSTLELDTLLLRPGFSAHLSAILLQHEIEFEEAHIPVLGLSHMPENWQNQPFAPEQRFKRLQLIAERFVTIDPENLYFQWLRFRSHGPLNFREKNLLLTQLLAMPQFPKTHLPRDCERRADYLWQRDSLEYWQRQTECTLQFAGVDFLWMAALLSEEEGESYPLE